MRTYCAASMRKQRIAVICNVKRVAMLGYDDDGTRTEIPHGSARPED
ncbi:hypothetical protein SAMN04488032_107106 [Pacificibacter marinus]|uniref:Uncharacterized protein n=1 Tax=Pacificibacter marinus TaxID=658057 RepID=A0A1Y5SWB7_9RHOB|nr:hypothetical protein SAMN04488032_107106 [Pacificibacter marinus]SLN49506.1 hypothetical protein PAM7971_02427 [Pacificibacter marinus]